MLRRVVAVKELRRAGNDQNSALRLVREARLAARLEHPSIIPIYDLGSHEDGSPYYCMRLVQGRPLQALIEECTSDLERISLLPHVIAVADAMAYAHDKGILHRDLKPDNVLVGEFGQTIVIDWGLAKDATAEEAPCVAPGFPVEPSAPEDIDLTHTGQLMGTLPYMPPEQAAGATIDARADVYSIGAILYHLLSGRRPYAEFADGHILGVILGRPPREIADLSPDLPADLHAIIHKAMARDPVDRYPDARTLASDLKRFQAGQLITARTYTSSEILRRWLRRYRFQFAAVGAAVIVLVLMSIYNYKSVKAQRDVAEANALTAQRAIEEAQTARRIAERERDTSQRQARQIAFEASIDLLDREQPHAAAARLAEIYADAADDLGVRLLLGEATRSLNAIAATLPGHEGGARRVRFAPDGRLAVLSRDGSLYFWDLPEPVPLGTLTFPDGQIMDFSFDDRLGAWRLTKLSKGLEPGSGFQRLDYYYAQNELEAAPAPVRQESMSVWRGRTTLFAQHVARRASSLIVRLSDVELDSDPPESGMRGARRGPRLPSVQTLNELYAVLRPSGPTSPSAGSPRSFSMKSGNSWDWTFLVHDAGEREERLAWELHRSSTAPLSPCARASEMPQDEAVPGGMWTITRHADLDGPDRGSSACRTERLTGVRDIDAIDVSPDGKWIAVSDGLGKIIIIDADELVARGTLYYPGRVHDVQFSPDSTLLAAAASDGNVVLWRHHEAQASKWIKTVQDAIVTADGPVVYLTERPATEVRMVELGASKELDEVRLAERSPAEGIQVYPTATDFIFGQGPQAASVDIVDLAARRRLGTLALDGAALFPLGRSADGRHLLFSYDYKGVLYWDIALGRTVLMRRLDDFFVAEGMTPDRRYLLAQRFVDGEVDVLDAVTGAVRSVLRATTVDFSPDGRLMFTREPAGIVKVFHADSMEIADELVGHEAPLGHHLRGWTKVAWHTPDGSTFLVPELTGRIGVFDARTLASRGALDSHEGMAWKFAFSPDSTRCVSISSATHYNAEAEAILWDLDAERAITRLDAGGGEVQDVDFSPDSSLLAVAREHGRVDIWSLDPVRYLLQFSLGHGEIRWIKFSPDGEALLFATGGRDGLLVLGTRELRREARNPSEVRELVQRTRR